MRIALAHAWQNAGATVTIEARGHVVLHTASRRTIALPEPRYWGPDQDTDTEGDIRAFHAVRAVLELDQKLAKLSNDRALTELGKAQAGREPKVAAVTALAGELVAAEAILADHKGRLEQLYRPRALEAGDAVGAILDGEARRYWLGLDDSARGRILAEAAANPAYDALVTSLKRSPFPIEMHKALAGPYEAAWREVVGRRDPEVARQVRDGHTDAEWAAQVATLAARQLAERIPDRDERASIYRDVRHLQGAGRCLGLLDGPAASASAA